MGQTVGHSLATTTSDGAAAATRDTAAGPSTLPQFVISPIDVNWINGYAITINAVVEEGVILSTVYSGGAFGSYDDNTGEHGFIDSGGVITTIDGSATAKSTSVKGINAAGVIAGDYYDGKGTYAYILKDGAITTINGSATAYSTYVQGIDAAGDIAGNYNDTKGSHGYVYKDGVSTTIVGSATATFTYVQGIDAAGDVAGTYFDSKGVRHGFVDQGGVITTINGSATATSTEVGGIDAAGDVFGFYSDKTGTHGFVDKNGVITTINGSPQATSTQIVGIDAAGEIYGSYTDKTGTHGFVDKSGKITTINASATATATYVQGINAAGDIAGTYYERTGVHGFVDKSGAITTINGSTSAFSTSVLGIDGAGNVYGSYQDYVGTHTFVDRGGVISDETAAGVNTAVIQAMDSAGGIAGKYSDDTGVHAFLYKGGVFTTFDGSATAGVSFVTGIDAAGDIVGTYSPDGALDNVSFFEKNGVITTIAYPSAYSTTATGIDAAGNIYGYFYDNTGRGHGFVDEGGTFSTIDGAETAYFTSVQGIDAAGEIAGYYTDGSGANHGFIDKNGVITTIDGTPTATDTEVTGISAAGIAYGFYTDGAGTHAYVDKESVITTVAASTSATTTGTTIVGVDAAGDVAGVYYDGTGVHGFVEKGGTTTTINVSKTATQTDVTGIDSAGDLYGTYNDASGFHSFVIYNAPQIASVRLYEQLDQATQTNVLFAQRYASDATKIGGPIQVTADNISVTTDKLGSLILADGSVLVTYDYNVPSQFTDGYYAYRYLGSNIINPDGTVTPGAINFTDDPGPNGDGSSVSSVKTIALKSGGYAYVVETAAYDHYGGFYNPKNFGVSKPSGVTAPQTAVVYYTHADTPYAYESDPQIVELRNGDISLSWTSAYDPDSFAYGYPSGESNFVEVFDGTGHPLYSSFDDFDGTLYNNSYSSSGQLVTAQIKYTDGSSDTKTYDPSTSRTLSDYLRHADGSHKDTNFAITGKPYTVQTASYDKVGHLLSMTRTYSNGVTAFTQINNPDGSGNVANYDTSGRPTTSIVFADDGSRDVTTRTYASAGTSPTPLTIEHDHFGTNGKIASSDLAQANGSHNQVADVAGVSLTSTTSVADSFKSSTAGGDTFVFSPAFGQDLITGFHAVGAAHDTIQFDSSIVPDYAHLQAMVKPSGHDTLITVTPTDTLLLKGVAASALVSQDFTFVSHHGTGV